METDAPHAGGAQLLRIGPYTFHRQVILGLYEPAQWPLLQQALCRDHGMPTEVEYTALGLLKVPDGCKHFSEDDGYRVG